MLGRGYSQPRFRPQNVSSYVWQVTAGQDPPTSVPANACTVFTPDPIARGAKRRIFRHRRGLRLITPALAGFSRVG